MGKSDTRKIYTLCWRVFHSSLEKRRGPTSMRRGIILKTATLLQGLPSRIRKPSSFRSLTRVREVLPQQIHHQHERLVLGRLDLQPLALVRDAKTIGNILAECAFR